MAIPPSASISPQSLMKLLKSTIFFFYVIHYKYSDVFTPENYIGVEVNEENFIVLFSLLKFVFEFVDN